MEIKIECACNGAIVRFPDDPEELRVYKFDEDDLDALAQMLWDIAERLHIHSRHNRQVLEVRVEHGDKYECKDRKCKICGTSKPADIVARSSKSQSGCKRRK